MTTVDQNAVLFERAQKTIPGGVNSPVRAFRQVGGVPRFVSKAKGPYFWDANNKRYIDLIMSWGPMIVGHANPEVVEAVQRLHCHVDLLAGSEDEVDPLVQMRGHVFRFESSALPRGAKVRRPSKTHRGSTLYPPTWRRAIRSHGRCSPEVADQLS